MGAHITRAIVLLFCCTYAVMGQDTGVSIPLRVLEETPIPSLHLDSPAWRTIPGEGKFYVQNGIGTYLAIDLSGEAKVALDLSRIPATSTMNPKDIFITDFADDPRGGVIAGFLWQPQPDKPESQKPGILHFDEQGAYSGMTWLQSDIFPAHVAEFSSSGNYLISGYTNQGVIEVSVFDYLGKVLVAHVLPETSTDTTPGDQVNKVAGVSEQVLHEAGMTQIVSGDDDAVYLFDPIRGRKVLRVQPSGQHTEIKLGDPPLKEGEPTLPISLFVSHGNIYLYEQCWSPAQRPRNSRGR